MAVESEVKRGKGKCCSIQCRSATASKNRDQKGAANNNWKGDLALRRDRHKYKQQYPEKYTAHQAVKKALRQGLLIRQPCEVCKRFDIRIDAHHDDYRYPLQVRWLCQPHHKAHHVGLKKLNKTELLPKKYIKEQIGN